MNKLSNIFNVLSNPNRLCILTNLYRSQCLNVTYLQHCSNSSQSNVSQQLAKLRDLKIIDYEKRKNEVYYKIIDKDLLKLLKLLDKENLLPEGGKNIC